MQHNLRHITITFVCLNSLSMPALGQEQDTTRLEDVTVTATRSTESISSIPGAVTVVTRKQVEEQMKLSRDIGDMLGKLIPGLSSPTQSQSMQGFNLRGRKALVLIDGIPQNTTRDTLRNLTTIHPSAIERIEVLPGATAIYGESAAGGIISIITKAPGEGPMRFSTDTNFNFSLSHPDDSPGGLIRQEVSGKQGIVRCETGVE